MIIHAEVEQKSPAWWALRLGRPTASEFSKIVTSTGESSKQAKGYAMTLAAELYAGKPMESWEGNSWTERGTAVEATALELYEFSRDVTLQRVGFVTDDAGSIGCSPDSLIGNDGMVEVKVLKAENHVKAILYYEKHGRCPPDYVQQTQGQLMIAERLWCDLVFYHPELPLLVIRQEPVRELHAALRHGIAEVCRERDAVLAVLRGRQGAGTTPRAAVAPVIANRPLTPAVNLADAAPLF